jgi:signal transduction histidine kinase
MEAETMMPRVLIADDNVENRYMLKTLLTNSGFGTISATNGREALNLATEHMPDLIISDILMPIMDGYALCRHLKADDRLKRIPFVFYTATYTDERDAEFGLSLGADRYLIKPEEPVVILRVLKEVLSAADTVKKAPETAPPLGEEMEFLRQHNEVLFRKLEKKMADLEEANRELEQKVAEKKRLEEQLRQAQKMEAIGRFSAGIAHDFNNILTAIVGYCTLTKMTMEDDDPRVGNINHILASADRAANLTGSLLAFSSKQEMKLRLVNLNSIIGNVETFLRRIIGEDIKLEMSLRNEDIPIFADSGQIEQVLMNLATNARDAMPAGGLLTIGTDVVDVNEEFIAMHGYGEVGRNALLTFADNGVGMDEAIRLRIFEPFFTTKEAGHGTGLGLSIIYGIISQHKGHISAYSEPGMGTTFRILLPLEGGDVVSSEAAVSHQPIRGGDETILVVDDEEQVRRYLNMFLTTLGYRVFLAQDGREAIKLFCEWKSEVDLVLMDVIMPNMNGSEAAREIRKMKGDIKIIFTSGYPYDSIHERKLLEGNAKLIMKPLMPTDLARELRAALDDRMGT